MGNDDTNSFHVYMFLNKQFNKSLEGPMSTKSRICKAVRPRCSLHLMAFAKHGGAGIKR